MHSVWRSVLVWLMALALPVQGLAAAGMRHCMSVQYAQGGEAGPHGFAEGHRHHPHHASAVSAHSVHVPGHDGAMAAQPQMNDAEAGPFQGAKLPDAGHKCSACASCCAALALPVRGVELPFPLPEHFARAAPAAEVRSFIPGRLERPPRLFLA